MRIVFTPFHQGGNWGKKPLSNWMVATKQGKGRAKIQTRTRGLAPDPKFLNTLSPNCSQTGTPEKDTYCKETF